MQHRLQFARFLECYRWFCQARQNLEERTVLIVADDYLRSNISRVFNYQRRLSVESAESRSISGQSVPALFQLAGISGAKKKTGS